MNQTTSPFLGALERMFHDGQQLVFWNDIDGEFSTEIDSIAIEGVNVIRLDRTPALQAKLAIENGPDSRWLVYAPHAEPEHAHDWLLDARLRGIHAAA